MPELTLMNREGLFVADSREVAEMIDKRHDHLLRDDFESEPSFGG